MSKEKFRKPSSTNGVKAIVLSAILCKSRSFSSSCHYFINLTLHLFVLVVYAYTSAAGVTSQASLDGIATQGRSSFGGVGGCSFAGGCELMISGSDMNDTPYANTVWMKTSDLTGSELQVPGPPLTCKS